MRHTITVIYRNGTKVRLRVKEFTVTKYASGGGFSAKWDRPNKLPLLLGAGDVMAIYKGRV